MMFFRITPQRVAKWQTKKDVKALAKCLKNDDSQIRIQAVQALAEIGDTHYAKAMAALLMDVDPDVRYVAAESLNLIATPIILPELESALVDENWMVRLSVIRSLAKIANPRALSIVIQQLKQERDKTNILLILELLKGKMGIKQVQEIYEFYNHERQTMTDEVDSTVVETLRLLIESAGAMAIPVLLEQIKHTPKSEKLRLIKMIINTEGRDVGKSLETLIRDPDPDIQYEVLNFLSTCDSVNPTDGWFLVAILSPAKTLPERMAILHNLVERKKVSPSIRPWVAFWLDQENPFAGIQAGTFRKELAMATRHPESQVRYRGLVGLNISGDAMFVSDFSERLLDDDQRIRELVAKSLNNFPSDRTREFYDLWIGNTDPRLLRTPESPLRRQLLKLLNDPVSLVKARAAYLLGLSEDPDLIPALRELLTQTADAAEICARDAIQRMEPGLGVRNLLPVNLSLREFETHLNELLGKPLLLTIPPIPFSRP